jgi:hypothetical protein
LVGSGTTTYTATAPGYKSATATATHYPSGFLMFQGNFSTTTFSSNTAFPVYAAILNPTTLTYYTYGYGLRSGLTVNVPVTSSNTGVGTITVSPVAIGPGTYLGNTAFDPVGAGTTNVSVGTPAGFSTPSQYQQFTVTVTAPNIYFNAGASTIGGKDMQTGVDVYLDAAPPSPVDVTVTSADGTIATLGKVAGTDAGTSVTFTGITGTYVGHLYINGRSENTVTLTASGTGYSSDTLDVNVYPSGFLMFQGDSTTTTFSANTAVTVYVAILSPTTLTYYTYGYPLRPGITVNVPVTSSNTSVGTITTSPVTFTNASGYYASTAFDPIGPGTSTVSVGTPAGFSVPSQYQHFVITVTAPNIYFNSGATVIGGKDIQTGVDVYLDAAPPSPVDVTVTSANGGIVTLGSVQGTDAGTSVTFTGVSSTYVGHVYINGRSQSTVTLTASGTGYNSGTTNVNVYPSGFLMFQGDFATTTFSANTAVTVYAAILNPSTLTYYTYGYPLRPGITANVPVGSSNTSVGTITTSPVTFTNASGYYATTAFDPIAGGTTTVSVGTPAGFSTPSQYQQFVVTVNAPKVSFSYGSAIIVGKDLQVPVTVYLEAAPPSPVDVLVSSSSTGIATLSADPMAAGGATVTFTGVTSTTAGTFYVQGRALSNATLSGSAAGYSTGTQAINVYPSGFLTFEGDFTTSVGAADRTVNVFAAVLDPATLNYYTYGQPIRGGLTVNVPVTTDASAVGTMTVSPVSLGPNTYYTNATAFHPVGAGTTVVSVGVPSTFSMPSNYRQITVVVNP